MKNKIRAEGYLDPDTVIEQLDIKERDFVADLGCGRGYFVIPVAKKVGEKGKVYAIDILEEPLEAVHSVAKLSFLNNIITSRVNLEERGSLRKITQGKLMDLIMISNVMFANKKKDNIIAEASGILKKDQGLAIMDWKNSELPIAPPSELLVDPEEIVELCTKNGLVFKKDLVVGDYHWGKVFIKK